MNIDNILSRIIRTSNRTELEPQIDLLLDQLNDYKLYLQRDKRISFSQTIGTPLIGTINTRLLTLPLDFLFPIALRRTGVSNTQEYCKQLVLTRWMNREEFFAAFPDVNSSGAINTGSVNTYIFMDGFIVLGPILPATETFKLDYYRLLPPYQRNINMEDDFTRLYSDGLYLKGMLWIWEDWTPDIKRAEAIEKRLIKAETVLKKFVVNREEPMESTLELPTSQ